MEVELRYKDELSEGVLILEQVIELEDGLEYGLG